MTADAPTTILLLRDQGSGNNPTTWGEIQDTNNQILEANASGMVTVNCAGSSNVTLTNANYTVDQGKYGMLKLTGVLTGSINLIIPTATRRINVWNATTGSFTITVKTSGGTGVVVPQGSKVMVFCDGTDCFLATDAITTWAADTNLADYKVQRPYFQDYAEVTYNAGNLTGAVSLDYANGNYQYGTVTGNITSLTISNWPATSRSGTLYLEATIGGSGSYTITLSSAYKKAGGALTISTTVGAIDLLLFNTRDAGTTILSNIVNNFS